MLVCNKKFSNFFIIILWVSKIYCIFAAIFGTSLFIISMERIYTDYTASGRQVVLNNVPTEFSAITVENIRLVFNETQKNEKGRAIDPLVSTGCKENVESITYNGITNTVTIILVSTVPEIDVSDKLTIKIDMGESVGDIDLSNVAKQGTNQSATNTAILTAVENIDIDTSDLAKQTQVKDGNDTAISVGKEIRSEVGTGSDSEAETGTLFSVLKWTKNKVKDIYNAITDSTNGLSSIKTSAANAATDAAAAKVAAQSLTSLESDINAGKTALATAITAKGVTTSPTQSMSVMAQNISSIAQETIEIEGGEMYAKQLFGSLTTPNYWNLYEVMAYLLTKTSTGQYSILLCEFPKDGTQYVFGTAVSANSIPVGYVFSDDWQINGEGSLNIHANTESGHVWDDDLDMKGCRWVAWLFARVVEGAIAPTVSLGAAATNCPQPRSIHIGRHMGTITATANGVLSEIVVTDGNVLDGFDTGSYNQAFGKNVIIRNLENQSGTVLYNNVNTVNLYISAVKLGNCNIFYPNSSPSELNSIMIKCREISGEANLFTYVYNKQIPNLSTLCIIGIEECSGHLNLNSNTSGQSPMIYSSALKEIRFIDTEELNLRMTRYSSSSLPNLHTLKFSYKTNNVSKSIAIDARPFDQDLSLTDIELQEGWCKPLDFKYCAKLTKSNVQDHIFDRLGVNTSGTTVTIHLATAVYDLFTAEEIAAVTTRTSITIARG